MISGQRDKGEAAALLSAGVWVLFPLPPFDTSVGTGTDATRSYIHVNKELGTGYTEC